MGIITINIIIIIIIMSTLRQSRPNKAGLKYPSVRASTRIYVYTYVRACVRP